MKYKHMRIGKLLIILVIIASIGEAIFFVKDLNFKDIGASIANGGNSVLDDLISGGAPSRIFSPSFSFLPENSVYFNKCVDKDCEYYVLDTPDSTINIGVDNITSNPTCDYGWRYKFLGYSRYFKIGERLSDSDISVSANYPVLQFQDGINKNHLVSGSVITVFFDKNIKNAQFYDFVLSGNIVVYYDYRTLDIIEVNNINISGRNIILTLASPIITDYGRVLIKGNTISDLDGRIAPSDIVVGSRVLDSNSIGDYVIDNKKPAFSTQIGKSSGTRQLRIFFSENIYEIQGANVLDKIIGIPHVSVSDVNFNGNELQIYFGTGVNITDVTVGTGAVMDKVGNYNNYFSF